jgi:MoxR-like ATPase
MVLPAVDTARIDEALAQFDREERNLPKWQGWEKRKSYKHAVAKNDRLYPPKEILAIATGRPVSEFSGDPETNEYLRKRGFQIEALRLPTHSEVEAALHDLLISKAPVSVEPSSAYKDLADYFQLPERLCSEVMENSDENHWQNRVRQASRNLAELGVLDRSERGQWKIIQRQRPKVWVEKSLVKGRPDRIQGEHALGHALWSPLRFQNGADGYRNMRFVQPNDIVLHLTDNAAFTGVSIADDFPRTDFVGLADTDWAGLRCYRISLRDFRPLDPPLTRDKLFENSAIRQKLIDIRRVNQNLFYDPDLDLHQGGYLTAVPKELVSVLDAAYHDETDHYLLGKDANGSGHINEDALAADEAVTSAQAASPQHVWLYAPGARAMYWDEFHDAGIAAIGWDYVGDLGGFDNPEAIKARMDELSEEPESLVNATQCFDFARRMKPGDWIFVKKGRREIVGFGIVKSRYRFDADRSHFNNVRDVAWQKTGVWPTVSTRLLPMKTVTDITDDETLVDELEQLLDLTEAPSVEPGVVPSPIYTVEAFATESAIPQATILMWLGRLKRKQHLIFQGPPGTGKTYVAERLARVLISGSTGIVETVQFHPSYGYEDFMHGIRPVVEEGRMRFERMPGRFLQFCKVASRRLEESTGEDGAPCVLIIDEINRANLSRVFGELMYLLEYREKAIPLAGENKAFSIPENVYIIGTMNTADRSIALVDHALRRRFSFIHLQPDYDVLRSHLEKHHLDADSLIKALRAVNTAIGDRNYEIGISFFLKDGGALASTLKDVWEGEIEPYLEEYFYDQTAKLEPLRWKTLRSGILVSWNGAQ